MRRLGEDADAAPVALMIALLLVGGLLVALTTVALSILSLLARGAVPVQGPGISLDVRRPRELLKREILVIWLGAPAGLSDRVQIVPVEFLDETFTERPRGYELDQFWIDQAQRPYPHAGRS